MLRILVADQLAEQGLERLRHASGVTFDVRPGLSPAELAGVLGHYDGMLMRSGVRVPADVLLHPGRLAAIARAGVGVDNVDLAAATAAGVLVLNTPDANTIATAEHTIAMMLALHRRIPEAHLHVVEGGWERKRFEGRQLTGKTLGVVGLGRVGRAVARRALGLEMKVVAHDPFVAGDSALDGAVALVADLPQLLSTADVVSLHASLTSSSRHLIGTEQLAQMRPGAMLVNCARGALVDEAALAVALNEGRLAGAAVDVFAEEPPTGSPLLTARNIVLTPHLGASTAEAQAQVAVEAVESLLAYLQCGEIRAAVNVSGIPSGLSERDRQWLDLSDRLGRLLTCWSAEGVRAMRLTVFGERLADLSPLLTWQAVSAILARHVDERVNVVNVRAIAADRGITVEHACRSGHRNWPEAVAVTLETRDGSHEIEGAVFEDGRPRILAVDGYHMELVPEGEMVLIFNDDRPGVIGLVGQRFGDAGINIADMALSRRGGQALMLLKLDSALPQGVYDDLRSAPAIRGVFATQLPGSPGRSVQA